MTYEEQDLFFSKNETNFPVQMAQVLYASSETCILSSDMNCITNSMSTLYKHIFLNYIAHSMCPLPNVSKTSDFLPEITAECYFPSLVYWKKCNAAVVEYKIKIFGGKVIGK